MIGLLQTAGTLMGLSDNVWRRHSNPWSVYTRMFTALPLLLLAVWSRVWLGWWALLPVFLAVAWIWLNPRAFPEPARQDAWATRGVMGERIFLSHGAEIAAHHRRMATILSWLSVPGALVMVWGLVALWWEGAVFGMILTGLPKVWFVDRMVWVHDDWRRSGRPVPGFDRTDEGKMK